MNKIRLGIATMLPADRLTKIMYPVIIKARNAAKKSQA